MSFIALLMPVLAGEDINASICKMAGGLMKYALPLATISLVLLLLAISASALLPEWAQSMKGSLVKTLAALVFIGFVPSLTVGLYNTANGGEKAAECVVRPSDAPRDGSGLAPIAHGTRSMALPARPL